MSDDRTRTGIAGLDEMLNGGIPRGRVVLAMGGPGTGKTILCAQFLVNGIKKFGENGVFVTLEETPEHIFEEMDQFGWNLSEMEKSGKLRLVDASPIRRMPSELKLGKVSIEKGEFSMIALINAIQENVKEIGAKRIVIDTLSALVFQYPEKNERRTAILDLVQAIVSTGATCLITSDLRSAGAFERIMQDEEYLAHGVILMQTIQVGKTLARAIQIEKMRRTAVDNQPKPYRITDDGLEVFSKESVF